MSKDWVQDIKIMNDKFGVHDVIQKMDSTSFREFVKFRVNCIQEEVTETNDAVLLQDKEEIVDGLIDVIVFSMVTLNELGIDANKAWDEVLQANLAKKVGMKKERINNFGFPDLIKPTDWKKTNHNFNYGKLNEIF